MIRGGKGCSRGFDFFPAQKVPVYLIHSIFIIIITNLFFKKVSIDKDILLYYHLQSFLVCHKEIVDNFQAINKMSLNFTPFN